MQRSVEPADKHIIALHMSNLKPNEELARPRHLVDMPDPISNRAISFLIGASSPCTCPNQELVRLRRELENERQQHQVPRRNDSQLSLMTQPSHFVNMSDALSSGTLGFPINASLPSKFRNSELARLRHELENEGQQHHETRKQLQMKDKKLALTTQPRRFTHMSGPLSIMGP